MSNKKTYKVEGMMCGRCTEHVKKIVSGVDDIASCEVQLTSPQLTVEFLPGLSEKDQQVAESTFLEILIAEGYPTEPI